MICGRATRSGEDLVEESRGTCVHTGMQHEARKGKRHCREKVCVKRGKYEHRHGAHQARRETEGEAEGWARPNTYAGIMNDATSPTRCEAAAGLVTHASDFAGGAVAECSRVQ